MKFRVNRVIKKIFCLQKFSHTRKLNFFWQKRKIRKYFDKAFYLRNNQDVRSSGVDPIEHYLAYGWREGRIPNSTFNQEQYIKKYPEVITNNINPLLHCVSFNKDGEAWLSSKTSGWGYVGRQRFQPTRPLVVILPVYRDVELTSLCIDAALPGILTLGASLVIINDKSPDAGMQAMLDEKQQANPHTIKLFNNEKNLGFVATVNKGLDSSTDADVVLLNSDVIVGENWLECLRDEAYSAERIGTVTPLSNNTTISAFPNFLEENALPFGFSIDEIHQSFLQSTLPNLTAPTGIGFCMYIRRDCINEVGKLDEDTFGRGYGEENDFCQRAIKKGWLNILTPNLYAYHEGGVSFGADKQDLVNNALQKIDTLHPNYHADVRAFIDADLLKPARVIRLIELMRKSDKPVIMHVSHGLAGGVTQHIRELAEFISKDAISIMLIPVPDMNTVKLRLGWQESDNKITFDLDADAEAFLSIIKSIPLSCIHYHHVMNVTDHVLTFARDLGIPYQFTVHDYYLLNGNPTLTNEEFIYPGNYSDDLHNPLYPLPQGMTAIDWRVRYSDFWTNAERVIFPSQAAKNIFEGYYPLDKATVVWHPEAKRDMQVPERGLEKKDKYRIGILGALSREKGADFLEEIATLAKKNKLTYEFVLIGFAYRKLENVITTGEYQEHLLTDLIAKNNIDLLLFPALWPETYSYTLSYAISSGLPIMAPNLGAFPERLQTHSNTILFDHLVTPEDFVDKHLNRDTLLTRFSTRTDHARLNLGNEGQSFYKNSYKLSNKIPRPETSPTSSELFSILSRVNDKGSVNTYPMRRVLSQIFYSYYFAHIRRLIPAKVVYLIRNKITF